MSGQYESLLIDPPRIERPAWAVALATWVIGDLITTGIGLSLGAVEANPVAAGAITAIGLWILVPIQLLALTVFASAWWTLRIRGVEARVGIPIALSIVGVAIVANNLAVIARLVIA